MSLHGLHEVYQQVIIVDTVEISHITGHEILGHEVQHQVLKRWKMNLQSRHDMSE